MRLKYEKVIHHAIVNNLFGSESMKKSCNAQGSSKYYLFVTASSHSISEKIDKNQTVLIVAQKEEIMNSKRILLIAFNAFVLGTVISMITSGTNWDSTAVHVSSAFSLGLNILLLEYIGIKGE